MARASDIREQLLKSFRAELTEHIQTMTSGLLAIEQAFARKEAPEQENLHAVFRAAHSLKGAARAMGVITIEQLAHALENVLDGLRRATLSPSSEMFTACYQGLDAIQSVQAAYEAGETTPPTQVLFSLANLEKVLSMPVPPQDAPSSQDKVAESDTVGSLSEIFPGASASETSPELAEEKIAAAGGQYEGQQPQGQMPFITEETIRVDVQKLDALMATLSELLIARIRLEQRQVQLQRMQEQLEKMLRAWSVVRSPVSRLSKQQENGLLSLHRLRSVDAFIHKQEQSSVRDMRTFAGKNGTTYPMNGSQTVNAEDSERGLKELTELSKDADSLLKYVNLSYEDIRSLHSNCADLNRLYSSDTIHLSQLIDELKEEVERLRMLPFSTITAAYPRMVRDLALQSGKEATITIFGSDTELDKRVLEGIKDPLTHLLRNAVDHGIERPEVRLALGKPRAGQIILRAEQAVNEIRIYISDDGAGVDIEAVRQAVTRQASGRTAPKSMNRDAVTMNETELIDMIFSLGISTSQTVSGVSGRGVGLNVVRSNIEALNGRIEVEFQPGKGSIFSLSLPLSLTAARGLIIRAGGQLFAVPINHVERTARLQPEEVIIFEGHDAINSNNQPVALYRLKTVLDLQETSRTNQEKDNGLIVMILTSTDRSGSSKVTGWQSHQAAFLIDELVGEQEIVIKNMGKQLSRVAGVSGATITGSGEVVLVLDASDLIKLGRGGGSHAIQDAVASQTHQKQHTVRKTILVVDDSITTRTLEKNILEAAGYDVMIAIDGAEALVIIETGRCPDLVVTDIVMPGMNGFELTKQIKENTQTAHLPVILVTSLDSAEDKQRGIEVQADAYIVKGSFDQTNLLDAIEQLI
jgi:two-component system, chemotaxis family, sensor kinase CheA